MTQHLDTRRMYGSSHLRQIKVPWTTSKKKKKKHPQVACPQWQARPFPSFVNVAPVKCAGRSGVPSIRPLNACGQKGEKGWLTQYSDDLHPFNQIKLNELA